MIDPRRTHWQVTDAEKVLSFTKDLKEQLKGSTCQTKPVFLLDRCSDRQSGLTKWKWGNNQHPKTVEVQFWNGCWYHHSDRREIELHSIHNDISGTHAKTVDECSALTLNHSAMRITVWKQNEPNGGFWNMRYVLTCDLYDGFWTGV